MTKTGKILTAVGLLLLAAALGLTIYNLRSDTAARHSANAVLAHAHRPVQLKSSAMPSAC